MSKNTTILGGGIAGLAAGYRLRQNGIDSVIFDKNEAFGGLCRSFSIGGFVFDTFAHVNFSKDSYVMSMLEGKTDYLSHAPEALNYYHGTWVRNPVQTNLIDISVDERVEMIEGFLNRDKNIEVDNYEKWLKMCYGEYFTEHFPAAYTRKYWTVEPKELEAKWVENRMYVPTVKEILRGAMTKDTPNVHYTKEIHYPVKGGYGAFLEPFAEEADIRLQKDMAFLDTDEQYIRFRDGEEVKYDNLISTIPLTHLIANMKNVPEDIKNEAEKLEYTSGLMVSIGLKCENVSPALWFYIYDEDIYPARVYAPNIKSPNNVPNGCCALQAEIYYSKRNPLKKSLEEIKEDTINQLIKMGLFQKKDIMVCDIRQEEYANIMFTPAIYSARNKVKEFLDEKGIFYAGRFGEWDYLWTGQSVVSGTNAADKIMERKLV